MLLRETRCQFDVRSGLIKAVIPKKVGHSETKMRRHGDGVMRENQNQMGSNGDAVVTD